MYLLFFFFGRVKEGDVRHKLQRCDQARTCRSSSSQWDSEETLMSLPLQVFPERCCWTLELGTLISHRGLDVATRHINKVISRVKQTVSLSNFHANVQVGVQLVCSHLQYKKHMHTGKMTLNLDAPSLI